LNASEIAYYASKAPTYDEIHQSIPETDMSISTAIFVPDTSAELSACKPDPNGFELHPDDHEEGIHVDLWLRDRDVVTAINAHPEGRRRTDYVRTAIRIGVLALQQAQGRIDTESVRNEGDRLIAALENRLAQYQDQLRSVLGGTLKDYFDPDDGRFTERVERLIRQDGDLEKVIRTQMDVAAVGLKESIDNQVGPRSSLAQLLTPGESNALIAAIQRTVDALLTAQREKVVAEFSLDRQDSALARLLTELRTHHGRVAGDLKDSMATIVSEFSLDKGDSALSRLINRVEAAQRQISAEFTLDEENSALSRMRRDLLLMIETIRKESVEFQNTVVAALEAMKARRQEAFASTRHGKDFEQAVYSFIEDICQKAGDIPEHVGDRVGEIKHCKVGDCVITLGPDCEAAAARIVCEMKEDASYDLRRSLDEIGTAKANRKADVGLFIHSSKTAPNGLKRLARYGNDVVVVWDSDDEGTDAYLCAGLMVSKALAVRNATANDEIAADIDLLEKAIREIERQSGFLEEIKTSSSTIKNGADRILNRVETMRAAFVKQIEALDTQAGLLRKLVQ
jgi:hypothetical protein